MADRKNNPFGKGGNCVKVVPSQVNVVNELGRSGKLEIPVFLHDKFNKVPGNAGRLPIRHSSINRLSNPAGSGGKLVINGVNELLE